jgi:hypothetical protein
MVLPAHMVHTVQVTLKLVSNEGHFTLQVEPLFRLLSPLGLQSGHGVLQHGTCCACATNNASYVELGQ